MGGDNANVIPDEVLLRGTVRTLGGEARPRTKEHIRKVASGVAEMSGTQIEVSFDSGCEAVTNDPQLTDLVRRSAVDLLGRANVDEIPRPSMGAEDFANYLEWVPGSMFRLGATSDTLGGAPLHSSVFDIDEQAMLVGAKILARAVVLWWQPQSQPAEGNRA